MNDRKKHEIATSFPDQFETNQLNLEISTSEFSTFEKGIFAIGMHEKWNVFVLDNIIYFARSWTNKCIYKVFTTRKGKLVTLSEFQVNRDENEYKSKNLDFDTVLLKQLLQTFLNREDFYSDPKLELPLIKSMIEELDQNNECKKTIGSNNVGLTRKIYNGLSTEEQKEYFDVFGWDELKLVIAAKNEKEPLISLRLQNRNNKTAITYFFDKDANALLGQISIKNKLSSS
tara:strand:+ start:144 stop:833 length:690 start_codon:yes stop_codon:yes gene_type:complete